MRVLSDESSRQLVRAMVAIAKDLDLLACSLETASISDARALQLAVILRRTAEVVDVEMRFLASAVESIAQDDCGRTTDASDVS